MTIEFMEPQRLHAGSDTASTADIATFLEAKYKLVENFTIEIRPKLLARITKVSERYLKNEEYLRKSLEKLLNQQIGGWLQNEWRNYINKEMHKIKTKAAEKEKRQPFVNTGDYFKSMVVYIKC